MITSTANTYIIQLTSFARPAMILSRGYAIRPAEIPLAMLYVNGIKTITRNAGNPSVQSSKSILRIAPNMRAPTMIRTGDVAAFGTKDTNGAKNKQIRNNMPVVTAVKPVRPPAPTPAALSTKAVIVDVPSNAPALTPIASTVGFVVLQRPYVQGPTGIHALGRLLPPRWHRYP